MQQQSISARFYKPLLAACMAAAGLFTATVASAFGFDDVAREAQAVASQPYRAGPTTADALKNLSYDEHRSIRFQTAGALWREQSLPFEVQFFHAGRGFTRPLALYEVVNGQARALTVPRQAFNYGPVQPPAGAAAEVAGLRLHFPLNNAAYKDEVIAFLGASYLRALGAGQQYGLSARGLAVDTVGGNGEEFPVFTTYWLQRPAPGATEATLYALMESPRVTGAYRFVVKPGAATTVDVTARLWLREPIATLGIAPLTSMFLFGENEPRATDYRPEVHDSDGLQIEAASGEWLWRPLINPKAGSFVTSFAMDTPRGFGLMQRDRNFDRYEDLEARYERRPSAWVQPLGDWGQGRVELLQFHTPDETHDNIAAYWVPARPPEPGTPIDLAWRLHWQGDRPTTPPGAFVVQSRRGHGYHQGTLSDAQQQFHLDFDGPALRELPAGTEVQAIVTAVDNAKGLRAVAYPNPVRGGWRVSVNLERENSRSPVELRAFLRAGDRVLSETWSYALPPE